MENDCELLKLAARSIRLRFIEPSSDYNGSLGLVLCDEHQRPIRDWNPLKDDGDAFRLAIAIGLCITLVDGQMFVGRWYADKQGLTHHTEKIAGCDLNGRCAGVRRAIVNAAAEIERKQA